MNVSKRDRYTENLYAAMHTISVKSDTMNLDNAINNPIAKQPCKKKNKGEDSYSYYVQLNPNKAVSNNTMIKCYSSYEKVLHDALKDMEAKNFRVTRADLSFNSDDPADYELFKKLNKLLICCIADKYQIDNCYQTSDLWTGQSLSVAVKDQRIEAENYNKELESHGMTDAKMRLELRSKSMRGNPNLYTEFTQNWFKRLDDAVEHFDAVQTRYNVEMVKEWESDQALLPRDRMYTNFTGFLLVHRDNIFTRKQLVNLFEMCGSKSHEAAKNAATKFKEHHKVEFFSKTDLRIIVKTIKDCTLTYFSI